MKWLAFLLLMIILVSASVPTWADTTGNTLPSKTFYKEPPREVNDTIVKEIKDQRVKLAVTDTVVNDVANTIKGASIKNVDTQLDLISKVTNYGPAAIIAIADLLVVEDESTRSKALTALTAINKPLADGVKAYIPLEKLVIQLYNRSLFDSSREIRSKALALLTGLGWGYVFQRPDHKVPTAIKLVLEQVVINDPIPEIAQQADYSLQDLGFKPRDPERQDYVN